jgi:hypothetical protein
LQPLCLGREPKARVATQLMMLDEIYLIGKRILKFTDLQLRSSKHVHTKFFGNLDVIIICDIYQVQPIHDVRVQNQYEQY